jgi:hypothetical protein
MNPFRVLKVIHVAGVRKDPGERVELDDRRAQWFLDMAAVAPWSDEVTAPRAAAASIKSPQPRVGGCGGCGWR